MRATKLLMLLTDLGFAAYWLVTALGLIPESWLFKDYHDPLLMAWNWSFLPLDLLVSASGLAGLALVARRHRPRLRAAGRRLMLLSLAFTLCSGLMAIAFWAIRADFDPLWWSFNGFLLLYPIPGIIRLVSIDGRAAPSPAAAPPSVSA
jgi:hypothetical protein